MIAQEFWFHPVHPKWDADKHAGAKSKVKQIIGTTKVRARVIVIIIAVKPQTVRRLNPKIIKNTDMFIESNQKEKK